MFVQIIEGRTTDWEGIKRLGQRWQVDLMPGATGFLGSTAGITPDGLVVQIARFRDEASARANSDRPEQGDWWTEMEKHYDDVSFTDSNDVTTFLAGGTHDAGFVQVMKVSGIDRASVERLDGILESYASARPDVIGGIRAWTGADSYVEVVYFTSEAEARAGERSEIPAEMAEAMAELGSATTEYLDLGDLQLL